MCNRKDGQSRTTQNTEQIVLCSVLCAYRKDGPERWARLPCHGIWISQNSACECWDRYQCPWGWCECCSVDSLHHQRHTKDNNLMHSSLHVLFCAVSTTRNVLHLTQYHNLHALQHTLHAMQHASCIVCHNCVFVLHALDHPGRLIGFWCRLLPPIHQLCRYFKQRKP